LSKFCLESSCCIPAGLKECGFLIAELNPDIAVEVKIGLQKKRKANKNAPFR